VLLGKLGKLGKLLVFLVDAGRKLFNKGSSSAWIIEMLQMVNCTNIIVMDMDGKGFRFMIVRCCVPLLYCCHLK
jgi:hypothetical protein